MSCRPRPPCEYMLRAADVLVIGDRLERCACAHAGRFRPYLAGAHLLQQSAYGSYELRSRASRFAVRVLPARSPMAVRIDAARDGHRRPHISTQRGSRSSSCPLPPLPTQRKIAAILSAYDDLIENNNRRIKILEEMAQRIYREWFVDFRYPGHESVPLVDSELGPIPEGWTVRRLCDVADGHYRASIESDRLKFDVSACITDRIRDIPTGESPALNLGESQCTSLTG